MLSYVYMIYTCSVFRIRAAFAWIMLVWFGSWHVCRLTRRAQVRAVCIYCSLAIKVGSCIENDRKNLLEVLRPRCRNLECCCLKVDCSRAVLRGSHFRTDFRSQCIVVSTRYSSCAWYPFRSDCGLHPSCLFLTETENSKNQGTILSLIRSIICLSWFNHFPVWYQTSCIWHHLAAFGLNWWLLPGFGGSVVLLARLRSSFVQNSLFSFSSYILRFTLDLTRLLLTLDSSTIKKETLAVLLQWIFFCVMTACFLPSYTFTVRIQSVTWLGFNQCDAFLHLIWLGVETSIEAIWLGPLGRDGFRSCCLLFKFIS